MITDAFIFVVRKTRSLMINLQVSSNELQELDMSFKEKNAALERNVNMHFCRNLLVVSHFKQTIQWNNGKKIYVVTLHAILL